MKSQSDLFGALRKRDTSSSTSKKSAGSGKPLSISPIRSTGRRQKSSSSKDIKKQDSKTPKKFNNPRFRQKSDRHFGKAFSTAADSDFCHATILNKNAALQDAISKDPRTLTMSLDNLFRFLTDAEKFKFSRHSALSFWNSCRHNLISTLKHIISLDLVDSCHIFPSIMLICHMFCQRRFQKERLEDELFPLFDTLDSVLLNEIELHDFTQECQKNPENFSRLFSQIISFFVLVVKKLPKIRPKFIADYNLYLKKWLDFAISTNEYHFLQNILLIINDLLLNSDGVTTNSERCSILLESHYLRRIFKVAEITCNSSTSLVPTLTIENVPSLLGILGHFCTVDPNYTMLLFSEIEEYFYAWKRRVITLGSSKAISISYRYWYNLLACLVSSASELVIPLRPLFEKRWSSQVWKGDWDIVTQCRKKFDESPLLFLEKSTKIHPVSILHQGKHSPVFLCEVYDEHFVLRCIHKNLNCDHFFHSLTASCVFRLFELSKLLYDHNIGPKPWHIVFDRVSHTCGIMSEFCNGGNVLQFAEKWSQQKSILSYTAEFPELLEEMAEDSDCISYSEEEIEEDYHTADTDVPYSTWDPLKVASIAAGMIECVAKIPSLIGEVSHQMDAQSDVDAFKFYSSIIRPRNFLVKCFEEYTSRVVLTIDSIDETPLFHQMDAQSDVDAFKFYSSIIRPRNFLVKCFEEYTSRVVLTIDSIDETPLLYKSTGIPKVEDIRYYYDDHLPTSLVSQDIFRDLTLGEEEEDPTIHLCNSLGLSLVILFNNGKQPKHCQHCEPGNIGSKIDFESLSCFASFQEKKDDLHDDCCRIMNEMKDICRGLLADKDADERYTLQRAYGKVKVISAELPQLGCGWKIPCVDEVISSCIGSHVTLAPEIVEKSGFIDMLDLLMVSASGADNHCFESALLISLGEINVEEMESADSRTKTTELYNPGFSRCVL
ncbi:hypothetical protein ADUPG1_006121 [Aduncisulcus paluster]|uniref:Uncharacterized protein n=1 Tax=Aduncisulcus paluster TaxID=2918883 RepID=A0ABQ5KGV9_9EUKA|nr:hypothetical protein ADUPG1_006121 [Aduncisulcus paluster]